MPIISFILHINKVVGVIALIHGFVAFTRPVLVDFPQYLFEVFN